MYERKSRSWTDNHLWSKPSSLLFSAKIYVSEEKRELEPARGKPAAQRSVESRQKD
jgi:hypothetical protein